MTTQECLQCKQLTTKTFCLSCTKKRDFDRLRTLLMSAKEDPKGFGKRFHFEDLNYPCYVTIDSKDQQCVFKTREECEQVKRMKITIFLDRNGVIRWPATHHTK